MTSNQPTTDAAEHERRVEEWELVAMAVHPDEGHAGAGVRDSLRVVDVDEIRQAVELMRSRPQTADGDLVARAKQIVEESDDRDYVHLDIISSDALIRDLAKCEPRPAPEVPEEVLAWAKGVRDPAAAADVHRIADWIQSLQGSDVDHPTVRAKAVESAAGERQREARASTVDLIVRDVCELPDRDSPEDWPEAMLVTADELRGILERHLEQAPASGRLVELAESWLAWWDSTEAKTSQEQSAWLTQWSRDMRDAIAAEREREPDEELERLRGELETERMRLDACGVAATDNLDGGPRHVLDRSSPAWSASYQDVCNAVAREVALRKERDEWKAKAEKAESGEREMLSNLLGADQRLADAVMALEKAGLKGVTRYSLVEKIGELAEQSSGDAKLVRLRADLVHAWELEVAAKKVQEVGSVARELFGAKAGSFQHAITMLDRLLSESPQPEPEAPIHLPGDEAEFLTALSDPSQQERTVKLDEAPSEPVPFDDAPLLDILKWDEPGVISEALRELAKRELARQSAKGAK